MTAGCRQPTSAMRDRVFIDSNVFLYAAEEGQHQKSEAAAHWLRHLSLSRTGVANLQIMNEVCNVLLKRGQMSPETIFTIIDGYSSFGVSAIGVETVAAARLLHFETHYSWWDCLLLAAAMEQNCRFFLTEDLQHGRRVRGLTIISPFRHSPPQAAHR